MDLIFLDGVCKVINFMVVLSDGILVLLFFSCCLVVVILFKKGEKSLY